MAPLFEKCSIVLELKTLPHKEKKRLALTLTEHGGSISYVVNKQCSLVVASSVSSLSSNRLRSIQKHHTPVVAVDYVYSCVERGVLLPVGPHALDTWTVSASQPVSYVTTSKQDSEMSNTVDVVSQTAKAGHQRETANVVDRGDTENLSDVPTFPSEFQVAKYSIFEKEADDMWAVVELQSATGEEGRRYRVVRKVIQGSKVASDKVLLAPTSEEAVPIYQRLRQNLLDARYSLTNTLHPQAQPLLSAALKQLRLEEELNTGGVSQEVGVFVELLWRESLGCLGNVLKVPISSLSLNDVSRAEGLLLQAWKKVKENSFRDVSEIHSVTEDFYALLPHRENDQLLNNANIISHKLDLCQLIRDVLNVSEVTLRSPSPSCLGKYRALRCAIENVPPDSVEFKGVSTLLRHSNVQVQQILRVGRGAELHMFKKELGNVRLLLHASSPSSFVGILSRGLLLPTVGVKHHGIERTDIGDLGSGIYFSDSVSTSLKYSKPSVTDGSRLLLVCDVALGECRDLHRKDPSLRQAPEGYHSVHGVRQTPDTPSEFQDDEFVVFGSDQVKLSFVVRFTVEGDRLKEFHPSVDTSSELPPPSTAATDVVSDEDSVWSSENPLDKVTAGLLDSAGQQLPLQAVHVKCKLMDLLSQVIIFQKYTNQSSVPIEAKYVFPLDDCAAVCGFEAFINGKHVVGQVKEKEQARKEYKQAVAKGHGAYLMDQDAPDVFTISVGNLPAGATVLIKVTFVSELIVRDGHVVFSLPGSVAPWQESAALNQTTQATVKKVCMTDLDTKGEFSLDMSIDMPNEITSLKCDTHKVRIKKTACKAVVSVVPGEALGPDGFQLSIKLSQIHLPRMWVENHPYKDSQASMLVFYPDFEVSSSAEEEEVVLLLDSSESMQGEALRNARAVALKLLSELCGSSRRWKVNVILFGTEHKDAFLAAQDGKVSYRSARSFIQSHPPVGGSTELWRPLRALSLLPPSRGLRNLLLLSDGHIQNPDLTLSLVRDATSHSRLFTCGLSPTANRHMLRALAQAGGGAYEFFDTKTKHTWSAKVSSQVRSMASPGCSSVSVKWQRFDPTAPPAVQAPAQLHALFNDRHTLVYGFVPHCTQASLHGHLSGQEINTMVSTSELQKTKGTFLHKLTARALIKDYEDGNLGFSQAEHEEKKAELKSFIVELSKEYSILSQFTSFVAVEERDSERPQEEHFTDVHKLVSEEDVDFLPYLAYSEEEALEQEEEEDFIRRSGRSMSRAEENLSSSSSSSDDDMGYVAMSLMSCAPCRGGRSMSRAEENLSSLEQPSDDDIYDDIYDDVGNMPMSSEEESLKEEMNQTLDTCYGRGRPMSRAEENLSSSSDEDYGAMGGAMGAPLGGAMGAPLLYRSPSGWGSPPPPAPLTPQSAMGAPLLYRSGWGSPPPPAPITPQSAMGAATPQLFSGFAFPAMFESAPAELACLGMGELGHAFGEDMMETLGFTRDLCPPPPPAAAAPAAPARSARSAARSVELTAASGGLSGFSSPPPPPPVPARSARSAARSVELKAASCGLFGFSSPTPPPPPPAAARSARSEWSAARSVELKAASGGLFGFSSPTPPPPVASLPTEATGRVSRASMMHTIVPERRASVIVADRPLSECSMDAPQPMTPPSAMGAPQPHIAPSAMGAPQPHIAPSAMGAPQPIATLAPKSAPPTTLLRRSENKMRTAGSGTFGVAPNYLREEGEDRPQQKQLPPQQKQLRPQRLQAMQQVHRALMPVQQQQQQQLLLEPQHLLPLQLEAEVELNKKLMNTKWEFIFLLQHTDGYWECTAELGECIRVDLHSFANVFLKNKGIFSLGVRARADILRLLATLLVLQLMRAEQLEEGKLLRRLFSLEDPPQASRPERWEAVKKAVDWACWADRQYPCVCSRLEMGWSWESSTRLLLGYDQPAPHSPWAGLTDWRLGPRPIAI